MCKRKVAVTLLAASFLAMTSGTGTASAKDIPGFVNKVKVGGGSRTVSSGQVQEDNTDLSGCKSNAWLIGSAKWTLGAVSKTSIYVKTIQLTYRAGVDSTVAGQFMIRGNGGSVWSSRWTAAQIKGDGTNRSQTFTINKSVPLDGRSQIWFQSNVSMTRTGGAYDCGPDTSFTYRLQPVS
ncbi:hypothetical protein [Nonomuraea sp. NPDC050202]|jgi:hypothetical protein|uniref:hypothetical protein n=1 Tax=Nonomuraea sp. NPDC050202 TaxID=3155035 RepID=UPI0033E819DA